MTNFASMPFQNDNLIDLYGAKGDLMAAKYK